MTLSNKSVRRHLRGFVCCTTDLSGQASAGASFNHQPQDPPGNCIRGNGEHNVQTLFLTPKGRILAIVAGYIDPGDFVKEIRFARKLWGRVKAKKEAERIQIVRTAHRDALQDLAQEEIEGFFADAIRRRRQADHRYVKRHALQPAREFRTEALVGNAKTFFGTSPSSTPPPRIGIGPEPPSKPGQKERPEGGSTGGRRSDT